MKEVINILIVEDRALLREALKTLLERVKEAPFYNVQEADSGEAAIVKVKENNFDVILMDYNMPLGISGPEATTEIVKMKPDVKVLGYSNYDAQACVEDMMKAGAKGYLLKNTGKEELLEAIQKVLSGEIYYCRELRVKLRLDL